MDKERLLQFPASDQFYGTSNAAGPGTTPGSTVAYQRFKSDHPGAAATIQVDSQSMHSTIR